MTVSSKIRLYDLAKELKIDTKRLIEEVRREGVDVSVPSNSISKELAEKIRDKYFPKKEVAVKRAVRIVKKAARPIVEEEPVVEIPEVAAPPEVAEAKRHEQQLQLQEREKADREAAEGERRIARELAPVARVERPLDRVDRLDEHVPEQEQQDAGRGRAQERLYALADVVHPAHRQADEDRQACERAEQQDLDDVDLVGDRKRREEEREIDRHVRIGIEKFLQRRDERAVR